MWQTAVLSWHVQNFIAIYYPISSDSKTNFRLNLNYDGKIVHEMGPSFDFMGCIGLFSFLSVDDISYVCVISSDLSPTSSTTPTRGDRSHDQHVKHQHWQQLLRAAGADVHASYDAYATDAWSAAAGSPHAPCHDAWSHASR